MLIWCLDAGFMIYITFTDEPGGLVQAVSFKNCCDPLIHGFEE
jgi:hypothetical protein